MLPEYRPAPDYETAIQQKYYNKSSNITRNVSTNPILHSSHPDIHTALHMQQVSILNVFFVIFKYDTIIISFANCRNTVI